VLNSKLKNTYLLEACLPLIHIDDLPWLEGVHCMACRIFPIPIDPSNESTSRN